GVAVGEMPAEYEALGASYHDRGARLDEIIEVFRTAWHDNPATHEGRFYSFRDVQVLPQPAHEIPVWVGGLSDAAFERAVSLGDGWQPGVRPELAHELVERVRARRPEESFTISLRTLWDANAMDGDKLRAQRDMYEAAGVQHVLAAPDARDLGSWLAGMAA